jgi:hypothetical protein
MWLFLNENDIYDPLNLVVLRFFRFVGRKKYTVNGILKDASIPRLQNLQSSHHFLTGPIGKNHYADPVSTYCIVYLKYLFFA